MGARRLPLSALGLLLVLSPCFSLSADRIRLNKGGLLRCKIFNIGVNAYKCRDPKGLIITVPKHKIARITFSGKIADRGYDRFFSRINAGLGGAQNTLNLSKTPQQKVDISSKHQLLRLGMDGGYQALADHLALYGGLEYSYSDISKNKDASYNYLTLNLGGMYFFPIPSKWPRLFHNTHIGAQARLLLKGSARFSFPTAAGGEVNSAIKAEGVGFGLSLGKEWYTSDWKIWGLSLSYTLDSFRISKEIMRSRVVGSVPVPGTPSALSEEIKGTSKMSFIGLHFSLAYD